MKMEMVSDLHYYMLNVRSIPGMTKPLVAKLIKLFCVVWLYFTVLKLRKLFRIKPSVALDFPGSKHTDLEFL